MKVEKNKNQNMPTIVSQSSIIRAVADKTRLEPNQLDAQISEKMLREAHESECDVSALIGQQRAKKALSFGLGVDAPGYNLYVMGEQATGRYTLVNEHISALENKHTPLYDWCYLNNLENEREPLALALPCEQSIRLTKDIENFIDELLATFPASFENPGYQRKKAAITRHFEQKYDAAIDMVESLALEKGIALLEEGNSISFAPIIDDKPLTDSDFSSRTDIDREFYYRTIDKLEEVLSEALIELPSWQRASSEQLKKLKRETVETAIKPLLKEMEREYSDNINILKYLRTLKHHVIDLVIETLDEDTKEEKSEQFDKRALFIDTYMPNVLVRNNINSKAPLVYEANPSYQNLFGKIEYTSVQGSVYTNYRMITPGALHKANGGYLVLDADKVLDFPLVWDSLKLALKFSQIKLDLPHHEVGMVNNITQSPQPIPLKVKLVLLGSRDLYYTLQEYDPEFSELVRVLVDFDHEIDVNQDNMNQFVARLKRHAHQLGLEGIDIKAMHEFVRYSQKQAEHQHKLSAKFADVIELLHEANFQAQQAGQTTLTNTHVQLAIEAKTHRSSRVSETFLLDIAEGHVLISTQGKAVGTLNGLTVLEVGDTAFGTPARVTATVYVGSQGVVDIEREVELGQSIHSKGVLLLTGYLGNKYSKTFPLTLSANIALEQSYGYVDGDSASLAELIALISSLTDIPLHQGIAITGSINQLGEVQAVGGINEKIEGYYTICKARGLCEEHGVIIPKSNVINLILSDEVKQSVALGVFKIYAVSNVDEAITIMTGLPAGELTKRGSYPKNTVHYYAISRLYAISNVVNGGPDE